MADSGIISELDIQITEKLVELLARNNVAELKLSNANVQPIFPNDKGVTINFQGGWGQIDEKYFGVQYLQERLKVAYPPFLDSFTSLVILLIVKYLGVDATIDVVASELSTSHHNLSLGQAKAATKRVVGLPLSAQERTQLSRLRQKVHDSLELVRAFGYLVSTGKFSIKEEINPAKYTYFICRSCMYYEELSSTPSSPPNHCGKRMGIQWGMFLPDDSPVDELEGRLLQENFGLDHLETAAHKNTFRGELRTTLKRENHGLLKVQQNNSTQSNQIHLECRVCKERIKVGQELMKKIQSTDEVITLPSHHGVEMSLSVTPSWMQTTEDAFMSSLKSALEKLIEQEADPNDHKFFVCENCSQIEFRSNDDVPSHHGRLMRRFQLHAMHDD